MRSRAGCGTLRRGTGKDQKRSQYHVKRAVPHCSWGVVAVVALIAASTGASLNGDPESSALMVGGLSGETVTNDRAAEILDEFRIQRLTGDFSFKFELEHFPRRGRSSVFTGQIWGTWRQSLPLLRIYLRPITGDLFSSVKMLSKNGPEPEIWMVRDIPGRETESHRVLGDELLSPILDGVLYSPFDLQMPFLYWPEYEYQGTERKKGRDALVFRMIPPAPFSAAHPEVGAVRLYIDIKFKALLGATVLDEAGEPVRSFKIISFKKFHKEWIPKSVDLIDEKTRDKTRFNVVAAALDQQFSVELFVPHSLKGPGAKIPLGEFRFFP